jgi:RimJ/RimL family protein N-acetyltransferase
LLDREDGRGIALRFALWPQARGIGLASEAAGAALVYAHETAGLAKVVAIAREDNYASRMVIGAIGMTEVDRFMRDGALRLVYQSTRNGRSAGRAAPETVANSPDLQAGVNSSP